MSTGNQLLMVTNNNILSLDTWASVKLDISIMFELSICGEVRIIATDTVGLLPSKSLFCDIL